MNVLLFGIDFYGDKYFCFDIIMIVYYDKKYNQLKLVFFMWDLYVDIFGYGKNKLNVVYVFGGFEFLCKIIKENFDIDVNYYVIVDFKGFFKVVDIIVFEGIMVIVLYEMLLGIGMMLKFGK